MYKENERRNARREGKFYDSPINTRIRERLGEKGWTAVQLREELKDGGVELTAEAIRQWISGYSQPKIDNIPVIANVLGCSVNYLFGDTDILQISTQTTTLAALDFPQEAIEQLKRRHEICQIVNRTGKWSDMTTRVHSAYTLFLHIIGQNKFWNVLDGLSNYIMHY